LKLLSFALLICSCFAYGQSYEWPPSGAGGIPVPNGAAGSVPYYISATTLGFVGPGVAGQCLISGGSGAPTWGPCVGSATGLTSLNAQTGSTQVFANDSNVIITSSNNTHSLGWASTLSVAKGGTSAALSPALGDIVYTDASKLVLLAAGTSGSFLKSNGAGAPSWATPVDMTGITSLNAQTGATQVFANDTNVIITSSGDTHTLGFSGTLAVARGGTGNSSFSSGSVIFSDGTILTQDNGNFFWDATNFSLGIGTQPQNAMIDIVNVSGTSRPVQTTGYGSNVGFRGRFANGNLITPTAALNGNLLNFISGRGYGDTGFAATSTGAINIVSAATFTDSSMPTYINFSTTPTGTTTASEVARFSSAGHLLIGTTTDNGVDLLQVNGSASLATALGISSGGTNNGSLGPVLGGVVYTDASKLNTLPAGTSGQFLKSNGGASPSWAIPVDTTGITSLNAQTGATQVFSNDANVIVTSSNNTHSLGWASTLSMARGGSSASLSPANGDIVYSNASSLALLPAGTSGQFLQSSGAGTPVWASALSSGITSLNAQTGATQVFANDTNVIITSSGNTHTLGFSGTLALTRGGTGASVTSSTGGIVYGASTSAMSMTVAGTSGQLLVSGGAGTPAWLSVLPIANGGTNNGSLGPVVGGVVYTDATKLNTLAAGTSGQVLTSQGGSAPIWSTPSATGITSLNAQTGATQIFSNDTNVIITSSNNTHALGFTGTLALARGGTGNSAYTSGSIPYSNGTILTQDNANLFWDGTNHRMGIGTSGPVTSLDIRGIFTVNENANASAAQIQANTSSTAITAVAVLNVDNTHGSANTIDAINFRSENATPSLTVASSIQSALSTTTGGSESGFMRFATRNAGTLTEWIRLDPTGNLGLGTTTPGAKLDIAGQFRTSGTTATIGTCGTSPTISGTNQAGTFTVGGGVTTACTISFSTTLANAPNACDISPANSTAAAVGTTGAYVSSVSTTAFVVTGLSLTGAAYYYQCF
jgi:hypothetical protein